MTSEIEFIKEKIQEAINDPVRELIRFVQWFFDEDIA